MSNGKIVRRELAMLREDNIFYAKRNLVDSIWKEAHIEGINVTFPDTQEIVEGRSVSGLTVDEIFAINNLKHAWQFVFDTLDEPLDLDWICKLNRKVGEGGVVRYAGDLRTGMVRVAGSSYIPERPVPEAVSAHLEEIAAIEDPVDRAVYMLAFIARAQMFNDGNKRTGQLAANKILIESGEGILAIPIEEKRTFGERLVAFYESADEAALCGFLKERCIDCPDLAPHADTPARDMELAKEQARLRRRAPDVQRPTRGR